jgi:hypothetical protein
VFHANKSSLAASLADVFASRLGSLDDSPEVASLAIDSRLCDVLAWENDGGEPEEYPGEGWEIDAYQPTLDDLAELRDDRDFDQFMGEDERALLIHSESDWDYRARLADEAERACHGAIL